MTPYLLVVVVGLGGALRVYAIGAKSRWLDEALSVWMGGNSLPDFIAWLLQADQHPPLYYPLLHFWQTFGYFSLKRKQRLAAKTIHLRPEVSPWYPGTV